MIAPLRKIYLAGTAGRFNSIFAFLQKKGVMELAETPSEITVPGADKDSGSFYESARRVEDLKGLIQFIAGSGKAALKGQKKTAGFNAEKILARFPDVRAAFAENRGKIKDLSGKISRLENALALPVDFTALSGLSKTTWRLFSCPAKKAAKLEKFFAGFTDAALECVYSDPAKKTYLLLLPADKADGAENLQRFRDGFPIEFMDLPMDPQSELQKLRDELVIAKDEEEMLYDEKKSMAAYTGRLLLLYDYYENLKIREASKVEKVFATEKMFVLSGWVREKIADAVLADAALNFPDIHYESRKPLKGEDVPVSLENNDMARPYEFLTSMYGVPAYGSVDPSPNAAVFFAFFFGLCLTDAMYGLVIAAVSAWALAWNKTPRELKKILKVFLGGGLFTVAAGAVTGGWFGPDFLSRLPAELGFLKIAADKLVLFDPVKDALLFVGIAIACGFIQVMWGMVLKCVDDFGQGRLGAMVFEDIAAIMIQISMPALLAVYALKVFTPEPLLLATLEIMFAAGAASIVLYNLITQEGPTFKLLWSYYGLYSVLTGNAFSDILSYIRLFALGLTTGLVAMAINEIVWIVVSWGTWAIPLAAVFFVILHAGNLVINMLGATVHTMRLQFYEFFTKFIRTGGHYFKPLKNFVKYSSLEI